MTSPVHESFRDPYPVGWVLTYRDRHEVNGSGTSYSVGVVTGDPVCDANTGIDSIPLALPGSRADEVVWVRDDDIIGIDPFRRIRHG